MGNYNEVEKKSTNSIETESENTNKMKYNTNSSNNIKQKGNNLKNTNLQSNHHNLENEIVLKFQEEAKNYASKLEKDINTIKNENIELKKEINILKNKNIELKKEINAIKNENIESKKEIKDENIELKKEIKHLESVLEGIINHDNNKSKNSSSNSTTIKNSGITTEQYKLYEPIEKQTNFKTKSSNKILNNYNSDIDLKELKNIFQTKKNKNKYSYHFLELTPELDNEILDLLIKSINTNKNFELNKNQVFELVDIEKKNCEIYNKIKKQLATYKRSQENYMMIKASFLKNVGVLVRLSHEIANDIIKYLIIIFEGIFGIHSLKEETVRLNFASWIKHTFAQQFFPEIIENQNILSQIGKLLKTDENKFFIELFPSLIQIYFLCFVSVSKVEIIYAKEDEEFDFERMIDDLFTDSEEEKKVLFTFLPGLFGNNQFFKNSTIHIVSYKVDEPNKFKFQKPIYLSIESKINISYVKEIKKVNFSYKKKNRKNNGYVEVEFQPISEPDISWDYPKYEFILLDSNNHIISNYICELEEAYYGKCICNMLLNDKIISQSNIKILDLS